MVIQSWVWRRLLGRLVGLEKPQHTINVEIGAEQPATGREGERTRRLAPWEQVRQACVLNAGARNPAVEVTPRVPLEKHHQLCMCASAPIVSDSLRPHGQRSLSGSMGFSRQECWSELPCPCPGDLPDSGIKTTSLMSPALAGRFFTTRAT